MAYRYDEPLTYRDNRRVTDKEKSMSVSFRYVSTPEGVKAEPCNQSELIEALEALPAGAHQLSRAGRFKMAQDIKRSFRRTAIITALRTAIKLRDPYWMMVYRAALGIGR